MGTFRLESGPHLRRWCPMSLPLAELVARPMLHRQGRERSVACQIEADTEGAKLWWLPRAVGIGQTIDYRLEPGEGPQRIRVRVRPAPTGRIFVRRGLKVAEVFAPTEGPTKLFLPGSHQPELTFIPRATGITEGQWHRVRAGKLAAVSGSVFGALTVHSYYVSKSGEPMFRERFRVRCFDGPPELLLLDIELEWHATTGPIWLRAPDQPDRVAMPVCRLDFAGHVRDGWTSPGWRGQEIDQRPAPFFGMNAEGRTVALLADSQGFAAPPRWRYCPPHGVEALPNVEPAISQVTRVPLGTVMRWRYRLAAFTASEPAQFANRRFLDFDCPPHVYWLNSAPKSLSE